MIGIYIGVFLMAIGGVTTIASGNTEVPMSGDFWDMPIQIKIAILLFVFGVLTFCVSALFMLIMDPTGILSV